MKKISVIVILVVLVAVASYFSFVETSPQPEPQSSDVFASTKFEKIASSTEVQRAFSAGVKSAAVAADYLSFTGCVPTPQVISIEKGSDLTVKNEGTSTIQVRFYRDVTKAIEPGASINVSGVYSATSTAFYTLSCNGRGPVGAVFVR